jgi:hypothetical protein
MLVKHPPDPHTLRWQQQQPCLQGHLPRWPHQPAGVKAGWVNQEGTTKEQHCRAVVVCVEIACFILPAICRCHRSLKHVRKVQPARAVNAR